MSDEQDWGRLAEYVLRRRTQLGMTQEDVREAGGPGLVTLRAIEGSLKRGGYTRRILARLERALRWEEGSVDRILAGGEPTLLPKSGSALEPPQESLPDRPEWMDLPMGPEDLLDPTRMTPEQAMRHLESWRIAGPALFWQGIELLADKRRQLMASRSTGTA